MDTIAEHISPDGMLRLNVQREGSTTIVGFNDCAWSTSGEFLASKWGISEDAAVTRFVEEVLGNRAIIAVAHAGREIRDVWVTDRPDSELKFKRHEETIIFRFWDGGRSAVEEPDRTPCDL